MCIQNTKGQKIQVGGIWSRDNRILCALLLLYNLFIPLFVVDSVNAVTGTTYYLDCNGSDSNSGTSTTQAWKTLVKANSARLLPGDSLLLKRGCTWNGTLETSWNGTSENSITVGAYGSGNLPKIQNGPNDLSDKHHINVKITGTYLIVEYLETTLVDAPVDPGCNNQTYGYYVGFNMINPTSSTNGGSYNTIRYSKATHLTMGVFTSTNTHNNRILYNTLENNDVMRMLTPKSVNPNDDLGSWGVNLHGDYHEVAYNTFANNASWCVYDFQYAGNAVELFEAQNNNIHHNISIDDLTFSELGGSSKKRSANNTYSYNLVVSTRAQTRFIIARGSGNSFGPTSGTKLYQNTIYYTGPQSQGFVCGAGCDSNILTVKDNIFWAEEKAAYADQTITESNNIYWSSSGDPFVQLQGIQISSSSMKVNPQFVDAVNRNFRLKSSSPAINAGANLSGFWLDQDLDGNSAPQNCAYDIGAYEYVAQSSCIPPDPIDDPGDNNVGKYLFIPFVNSESDQ